MLKPPARHTSSTRAILLLVMSAPFALAQEEYLRVVEENDVSIALEIATRTYRHPEGKAPDLALVGIAHVGDAILYEGIQDFLAAWDLVLYESVMPPGARGAGGDSDEERVASTRATLEFLAGVLRDIHTVTEAYPADLDDFVTAAAGLDPRYRAWVSRGLVDAWGRPITYAVTGRGTGHELVSLGADRSPGGDGLAADIIVGPLDSDPATKLSSEDGIQAELAAALGLEFQLEALDYDHSSWVCSDMAMDEIERELARRDLDFGVLQGSLAGTSELGQVMKGLVKLIPMFDAFAGGGVVDSMKIMLIETLGQGGISAELMEEQLGEGFAEVIIELRNQVVVDDLREILEGEAPGSIAILYGAAHMQDMAHRISDQLGYELAREFWITAMEVDLDRSSASRQNLKRLRKMFEGIRGRSQRTR